MQECGRQLNYDDHAVMDMIKSCMPPSLYGMLYGMEDLAEIITICKDVHARSPTDKAKGIPPAALPETTGDSPFSVMKAQAPDLGPCLNKLTEALNKLDSKQKPYKPQIYTWGCGGRGSFRGRDQGPGSSGGCGGFRPRGGFRGKPCGGTFDKSPTKRRPG